MQERSHATLTFDFYLTTGARGGVLSGNFIVVVHFGGFSVFWGKVCAMWFWEAAVWR
jgi:hypothetical protein